MPFNSLDQLLNIILSQPQWQKQKRFYELKQYWYEIVNHKVAQHTRPLSLKNEIFYIATSNAVWAQELSLQRRTLLRKLNSRLQEPIQDLYFASMKWHSQLDSSIYQDNREENHPSSINLPASKIVDKAETPKDALEKWFQQIKQRSSDWKPCPRCQKLSPQGELKRWQVCAICFRDEQCKHSPEEVDEDKK